MSRNVVHDFTAAGRVTNVHRIFKIEMRGQGREIVGVVIHVVALAALGGTAVAAPLVRDDAEAVLEKKEHLRIPIIGRKRPAMTEDDRLSTAPILVKNVDLRAVFFPDSDVWHIWLLIET